MARSWSCPVSSTSTSARAHDLRSPSRGRCGSTATRMSAPWRLQRLRLAPQRLELRQEFQVAGLGDARASRSSAMPTTPILTPPSSKMLRVLVPGQRRAVGLAQVGGEDTGSLRRARALEIDLLAEIELVVARARRRPAGSCSSARRYGRPGRSPTSARARSVSPAWQNSIGTPRARSAFTMAASRRSRRGPCRRPSCRCR